VAGELEAVEHFIRVVLVDRILRELLVVHQQRAKSASPSTRT
jgi:hypothetical protein